MDKQLLNWFKSRRFWVSFVAGAVTCSLLLGIVFGGIKIYKFLNKPVSTETKSATTDKVLGGSFNVLLMGCDVSTVRTDTIMLVNVDRENKTIKMLSIPRDTKVKIGSHYQKINASVPIGGIDMIIKNVKFLTGVPIHYYMMISPGTLASIVDAVGGVEYNVERRMKYSDPVQDLYIDLQPGQQTLTGDQAEQYCRFRSYLMGDIERTKAQERFMKALLEQKLKLEYVSKASEIYDAVSEKIKTNITPMTILNNISVAKMFAQGCNIQSFETPGDYNDMHVDGVSYWIFSDEDEAELLEICKNNFLGTGEQIEDDESLDTETEKYIEASKEK